MSLELQHFIRAAQPEVAFNSNAELLVLWDDLDDWALQEVLRSGPRPGSVESNEIADAEDLSF